MNFATWKKRAGAIHFAYMFQIFLSGCQCFPAGEGNRFRSISSEWALLWSGKRKQLSSKTKQTKQLLENVNKEAISAICIADRKKIHPRDCDVEAELCNGGRATGSRLS